MSAFCFFPAAQNENNGAADSFSACGGLFRIDLLIIGETLKVSDVDLIEISEKGQIQNHNFIK